MGPNEKRKDRTGLSCEEKTTREIDEFLGLDLERRAVEDRRTPFDP